MTVQFLKIMQSGNVAATPVMTVHGERAKVVVRLATNWFQPAREDAEAKSGANFVTWEMWGSKARCDAFVKYVHKGDGLYIEGTLQNRRWKDRTSGEDRFGDAHVVLDWKKDWASNGRGGEGSAAPADLGQGEMPAPSEEIIYPSIMDDDIPM